MSRLGETSEFRLYVSDVDDTLFSAERRIPGAITILAFKEMKKRGMKVGIASGRPLWQGLETHYEEWGLHEQFDFLIGMNGGELFDLSSHKVFTFHPLKPAQIEEIICFAEQFKGVNPFIYRDQMEVAKEIDEEMLASSKRHGTRIKSVAGIDEFWEKETGKILIRCPDEETAIRIEKAGKTEFASKQIACFRTNPKLVELQDVRVHKGTALKAYCELHGISLEETIAFGDAENDLGMLECAGLSVAMKNAMATVKNQCNDITEYEAGRDGVGRYLLAHIL